MVLSVLLLFATNSNFIAWRKTVVFHIYNHTFVAPCNLIPAYKSCFNFAALPQMGRENTFCMNQFFQNDMVKIPA